MKKVLVLIFTLFIFLNCSKDSNQSEEPEKEPTIINGLTISDQGIDVTPYKLVIDTLASDSSLKIIIPDADLNTKVEIGSILMDNSTGFLVEVLQKNDNEIIVQDASLDQFFIDGKFVFGSENSGKSGSTKENKNQQVDFSFNYNKELFNNGTSSINFNGNVDFNPTIDGEIDFGDKTFNINVKDAPLKLTGNLNITIAGEVNGEKLIEIGYLDKTILYGLVLVTYRTTIYDKVQLTASGSLEENITASANFNVNTSINYNQGFSQTFTVENTDNDIDVSLDGKVNLNIRHEIVPKLEVLFYRVAGPFMEFVPYDNWNATAVTKGVEEINWDFYAEKGIDFRLGVSTKLFGGVSYDYSWPVKAPERFYEMPSDIKLLSDENIQVANGSEKLENPIRVEVLDSRGNRVAGVLVYAEVKEGTGALTEDKVFTDSSGVAEFEWEVGCEESQKLEFYVKTSDESILQDKKLDVNATIGSCSSLQLIGDLIFGEVEVGTTKELPLTIKNDNDYLVEVTNIELPNGYISDWQSGTIISNSERTINITFSPTEEKEYVGEITITNSIDSEASSSVVSGAGIKNNNSQVDILGKWKVVAYIGSFTQTEDDVPSSLKPADGVADLEFLPDGSLVTEHSGVGTYQFDGETLTFELNINGLGIFYDCSGGQLNSTYDTKISFSGNLDFSGNIVGSYTKGRTYGEVCPTENWNDNYTSYTTGAYLRR